MWLWWEEDEVCMLDFCKQLSSKLATWKTEKGVEGDWNLLRVMSSGRLWCYSTIERLVSAVTEFMLLTRCTFLVGGQNIELILLSKCFS